MKSNKERGYYIAVYTCMNCKNTMEIQIPYGHFMITFVDKWTEWYSPDDFRIAPECEYCGNTYWSSGEKQK